MAMIPAVYSTCAGVARGILGYFFLPLGNKSETETSRALAKSSISWSETQRTPASILASVPLEMSQPARWHLPASPSWDSPFAVLTLAICLPVTFVGKSCAPISELDSNAQGESDVLQNRSNTQALQS